MRLARPCRSIVNMRSTGNHSSSSGTKVAHHDMHSWTRSAALEMLDCQATISGKTHVFLWFSFFLLAQHPVPLPSVEYACFFCVLQSHLIPHRRLLGCIEVERGLMSILILWQIGLVGEYFRCWINRLTIVWMSGRRWTWSNAHFSRFTFIRVIKMLILLQFDKRYFGLCYIYGASSVKYAWDICKKNKIKKRKKISVF